MCPTDASAVPQPCRADSIIFSSCFRSVRLQRQVQVDHVAVAFRSPAAVRFPAIHLESLGLEEAQRDLGAGRDGDAEHAEIRQSPGVAYRRLNERPTYPSPALLD